MRWQMIGRVRTSFLLPGALSLALVALVACEPDDAPVPEETAVEAEGDVHDQFLANLAAQCGQSFAGVVNEAPEGDPYFQPGLELVLTVRECSDEEVRIPVYAGDNASRTWIFTRTGGGIDLRHDHRYEDGTPEPNTFYGAFVSEPPMGVEGPSPNAHEFKRERDDGVITGWRVEIIPGERYTYGTQRDGEWRHRFDFDLSEPVETSLEPWGHPPVGEVAELAPEQEEFWSNLAHHCGQTFEGELIERPDPDPNFEGDEVMTVHFRGCGENRLAIPFHVDDNRSRTWLLTRTTAGLDLRHDHRHEDGSPEPSTWYGAHTPDAGSANRQEFIRAGLEEGEPRTGWAIEIVPDERYTYGTVRDGEWRYRIDFDLTTPVDEAPAPWGHEESTAAR
jgi:hypothetical protein